MYKRQLYPILQIRLCAKSSAELLHASLTGARRLQALIAKEARLDGRSLDEARPVTIDILPDDSGATVAFGDTRMHAAVAAEMPSDPGGRSGEGRLALDVRWSPMGSAAFTGVRFCTVQKLLQLLL